MLDPKDRALADQNLAAASELIPAACKQMYDGFLREGFEAGVALVLTVEWLKAVIAKG